MWLIGPLVAIALLFAAYRWLSRGTIFITHKYGYRGVSFGPRKQLCKITAEDIPLLLDALFASDSFDWLLITHESEGMDGFSLSIETDGVELSASWPTQPTVESEQLYRQILHDEGFEPHEDQVWNQGLGPNLERRSVTFLLPPDSTLIMRLIENLLAGPFCENTPLYAQAIRIKEGGPGPGKFSFKMREDFVEETLRGPQLK